MQHAEEIWTTWFILTHIYKVLVLKKDENKRRADTFNQSERNIDHLAFWCIINNQQKWLAHGCYLSRVEVLQPQTVQTTTIISNIKGKRLLHLTLNLMKVKWKTSTPRLPLSPRQHLFQNDFHFAKALGRWLFLKWAHAPRTPQPLAAFFPPWQ